MVPRSIKKRAGYDRNVLWKETVQNWFCHCRSRNFDVRDASCGSRQTMKKVNEIIVKVEQDRYVINHDTEYPPLNISLNLQTIKKSSMFGCQSTIYLHLRTFRERMKSSSF